MDTQTKNNDTAFSATRSKPQKEFSADPYASAAQNEEPQIEQFPGREHRLYRSNRRPSLPPRKEDLRRPLENDSDLTVHVLLKGWQSGDPPVGPMMTTAKHLPELMKSLRNTGGDFTLLVRDYWEFKARHQHRRIKELKHEEWDLDRLKREKLSFFKGYYHPVEFKPHTGRYLLLLRRSGTGLVKIW